MIILDPNNLEEITIKPSRFKWGVFILISLLLSALFFWIAPDTNNPQETMYRNIFAFIFIFGAVMGCTRFLPDTGILKMHKNGLEYIGCITYVYFNWEDIDEFSIIRSRFNIFTYIAYNLSNKDKEPFSFLGRNLSRRKLGANFEMKPKDLVQLLTDYRNAALSCNAKSAQANTIS